MIALSRSTTGIGGGGGSGVGGIGGGGGGGRLSSPGSNGGFHDESGAGDRISHRGVLGPSLPPPRMSTTVPSVYIRMSTPYPGDSVVLRSLHLFWAPVLARNPAPSARSSHATRLVTSNRPHSPGPWVRSMVGLMRALTARTVASRLIGWARLVDGMSSTSASQYLCITPSRVIHYGA